MSTGKPDWFQESSDFCRSAGITIMAWGPQTLVVEAKSQERAKEIATQLAQLGFKAIEDEGDSHAGMLTLSRDAS
jgi:phosphosulfolactate synthase (CoM biosynthesis protein A)